MKKGFTLLETIIVIAIIVLLATIIMYKFNKVSIAEKIDIESFYSDLKSARDIAIVNGTEVVVRISENGYSIRGKSFNVDYKFHKEYKIDALNRVLKFTKTGAPSKDTSQTINIKGKKTYTITIAPVMGSVDLK